MKNQRILSIPGTQRQAKCPTTVKAGDAVLLGGTQNVIDGIPAVAINDYESIYGGTTFETTGSYELTVIGASSVSPVANKAIGAGDPIYAIGTYDPVTNVWTSLTLSATLPPAALFFGRLDPQYPNAPVASGATDTGAWVRIGQG